MEPANPFGGGGLGAGLGLGMLITPIMIASMILRRPASPVRKLIDAGATSPETARRIRPLGIPREMLLGPWRRSGVARRLDDGRWYVDLGRERVVRRRRLLGVVVLAAILALLVWLLFASLGAPSSA